MPKPKTKAELLAAGRDNFDKLNALVDSFSEEERNAEFPEGTLNRNIRDVLAHLHHWHLLMSGWYREGMRGEKPDMPAEGFSWSETPRMNLEIREKYRSLELSEARRLLEESFLEVRGLIEQHSEEELFEKRRYSWTGSTSLGAYLISNTSSHYQWAHKLIRRAKR